MHEEADTRIFVHVRCAAMNGSKSVIVKAIDTDVVVIAGATFTHITELGLEKMWNCTHVRMIPVHEIISEKTSGRRLFHAFTGWDVVPAFRDKAKKSAWQAWTMNKAFTRL